MDLARGLQRLKLPSFAGLKAMAGDKSARLVLPVATVVAMALATLTALLFLVMPIDVLEGMSVDSGIASLITAAEPPLGLTARFAIAFIAALAVGGVTWLGLFLLVGTRSMRVDRKHAKTPVKADAVPVLRRRDAHPDAPAREPVFAHRDLGTPFLDVKADPEPEAAPLPVVDVFAPPPVERDLPADLDTPLARYLHPLDPPLPEPDPLPIAPEPVAEPVAPAPILAEPPVPAPVVEPEPVVAVAPEPVTVPEPEPEPRFAANERIETFDLTPVVGNPGEPAQPSASIHDLLDRLERGVAKRAPAPEPEPVAAAEPAPSLEDTLAVLRQLAKRVG